MNLAISQTYVLHQWQDAVFKQQTLESPDLFEYFPQQATAVPCMLTSSNAEDFPKTSYMFSEFSHSLVWIHTFCSLEDRR